MRVFFIGTGDIALPAFIALADSDDHQLVGLITQPDRPAGRQRDLKVPAIKTEAVRRLIPVFQPEKIRNSAVISQILTYHPDVIIVMAYGQILPKEILELPRYGCLNLHASLLPKYRGASPIHAAIVDGERETGITVIYMDEGLDTGDMLLKMRLDISREDTAGALHDRLANLAADAVTEALSALTQDSPPREAQDGALASYAPKLSRADAEIDWNQSAESIERKIRGCHPWPGAYTAIPVEPDGYRTIKIFSASTVALAGDAEPGTVMECVPEGIIIAAQKGGVLLRSLQPEGRRPMSADEFLRGTALRMGESCRSEG